MLLVNNTVPRASGETYFFRDQGQFNLLRLRLLPELIEHRGSARTLRLWSAGCASGEEAYSLAILVDMLLPAHSDWDIFILGSDIDQAALTKARHGRYGQWSFRMVPPALLQRYFQRMGDAWMLDERIRHMVTFRAIDLIGEPFPAGDLREMDLILCRNVFIYFSADAVTAVADKLAAALSDNGYLMSGHTELIGHPIRNLQSRLFAEGVVYRRVAPIPPETPSPTYIAPLPAVTQRASGVPPSAAPPSVAQSLEVTLAAARQFADRGEYDRAEQACRKVLDATPLAAGPHFLLAQLAQLRGDFERAEELLDKTLYIDPGYVAAYLELSALCERAGLPRAQILRRAALDIVRALPGDSVVDPYETTAAELAQWLAT